MIRGIVPLLAMGLSLQTAVAEMTSFEVEGNDRMQFSVNALEVSAGAEVQLTFRNVGTLPKVAMGHNWVLLKPGTNLQEFCMAGMTSAATDYVSPEKKSQVLAQTRLLGPGEEDVITFTAPTEPGEYPFVCTFPGHFAVMKGILTVKAGAP